MSASGHEIRLRASARTSKGQVRENNEDNIHLWMVDNLLLAVVADGMGGAAAGEEASRIAVESIEEGMAIREGSHREEYEQMADTLVSKKLKEAIRRANHSIVKRASDNPKFKGMGTTVTLAFVRDTHVIVAHVGDSRAYLVNSQSAAISQITADHSFVEALVAAGHITAEQAEDHPMRNVLYRALGQTDDIEVDVYQERLRVGDRVVLCSDGLTRHVKPKEIMEFVLADDNPESASQRLIDLANARGGEDNVSVIIISAEQYTAVSTPAKPAKFYDGPTEPVPDDAPSYPMDQDGYTEDSAPTDSATQASEDTILLRDKVITPPPAPTDTNPNTDTLVSRPKSGASRSGRDTLSEANREANRTGERENAPETVRDTGSVEYVMVDPSTATAADLATIETRAASDLPPVPTGDDTVELRPRRDMPQAQESKSEPNLPDNAEAAETGDTLPAVTRVDRPALADDDPEKTKPRKENDVEGRDTSRPDQ